MLFGQSLTQWWWYIVVLDLQAKQSVSLVHVKQSSTPQVLQVPFSFRYSLKYEKRHTGNINGVNWRLLPELFSYPNPSKSWPKNIRQTVVKSNTQHLSYLSPHGRPHSWCTMSYPSSQEVQFDSDVHLLQCAPHWRHVLFPESAEKAVSDSKSSKIISNNYQPTTVLVSKLLLNKVPIVERRVECHYWVTIYSMINP